MTIKERKQVNNERARMGLGRHSKKKSVNFKYNKEKKDVGKHSNDDTNQLRQLMAANSKYKSTIASLKSHSTS